MDVKEFTENMIWTKNVFFRTTRNFYKRYLSTQKRQFKEVSLKVPWGQVSGKWWEPYDSRPILTLHGWQVGLI